MPKNSPIVGLLIASAILWVVVITYNSFLWVAANRNTKIKISAPVKALPKDLIFLDNVNGRPTFLVLGPRENDKYCTEVLFYSGCKNDTCYLSTDSVSLKKYIP